MHRSANHAVPVLSYHEGAQPDPTGDTTDDDAPEVSVPRPRTESPGTGPPGPQRAVQGQRHTSRARPARDDTGHVPTPKEWAAEQVQHAPVRSAAWARSVAAIYGLDIQDK